MEAFGIGLILFGILLALIGIGNQLSRIADKMEEK
jgi:hypothetical protein